MHSGENTPNLGLPQWAGGDHPSWLDDMNPAFRKIDESYGELTGLAGEASKLIKDAIPVLEENTEKLSALDVREETDRAFLQKQVDGLKNTDTYLQGLIDALDVAKTDLENAVKGLDERLKEEEGTTEGFSSATNNTVMARFQVLQKELEEDMANLVALREEFEDHVADFNRKYRDLSDRMIDAEGDITVLKNRVQALEDWKSPFSQQVDKLEQQFGIVTTDVVNVTKRLDTLSEAVTVIDSEVHELRQKERDQDARLDEIVKQQGEDHNQIQKNKAQIEVNKNEINAVEMRVDALESSTAEHAESIGRLEAAVAENEKSIGEVNLAVQEHVQESSTKFTVITDRLDKHDVEMHSLRDDVTANRNDIDDILNQLLMEGIEMGKVNVITLYPSEIAVVTNIVRPGSSARPDGFTTTFTDVSEITDDALKDIQIKAMQSCVDYIGEHPSENWNMGMISGALRSVTFFYDNDYNLFLMTASKAVACSVVMENPNMDIIYPMEWNHSFAMNDPTGILPKLNAGQAWAFGISQANYARSNVALPDYPYLGCIGMEFACVRSFNSSTINLNIGANYFCSRAGKFSSTMYNRYG